MIGTKYGNEYKNHLEDYVSPEILNQTATILSTRNFIVLNTSYWSMRVPWNVPERKISDNLIVAVKSGKLEAQTNGHSAVLSPGDCMMVPEFAPHSYGFPEGTAEAETFIIHVLCDHPQNGNPFNSLNRPFFHLRHWEAKEEELLRIIALLQQTAANFSKSQNPRVDCELCLLQLCLPQLQLDAQSLNARLSRVEEQLASGVLVQARPAAAPEAADAPPTEGPVHETAPAASSSAAGQTLPEEVTSEEDTPLPDGFWPELCQRMRAELRPPVVGFFTGAENAPLQPRLRGDALQLVANDAFVKAIVDKPAVRELVQTKAATLLGRPVAVQVVIKGQKGDSRALEELISFGQAHSDIFSIHEE